MRIIWLRGTLALGVGLCFMLLGAGWIGGFMHADIITATVVKSGNIRVQYIDLNRSLSLLYQPPMRNIRNIYLMQHHDDMFVLVYDAEDTSTPLQLFRHNPASGKYEQVYASTSNVLARVASSPNVVGLSNIISFAASPDEQYYAFYDFSASQVFIHTMHDNETLRTLDVQPQIINASIIWAANSRKVAFRSSQFSLQVYDIERDIDHQIDISDATYISHQWTHDSQQIILTTERNDQYQAHIIPIETQVTSQVNTTEVTVAVDNPGMWCGSRWLAFQSDDSGVSQVRMMDISSGTLYNPAVHVQFNPSGANYGWFWVSDSCEWLVIQQPHERRTPGRSQYESRLHLSNPTATDVRMIYSDGFALPTLSDAESVVYFTYDYAGNKHLYRYWINRNDPIEYLGMMQDFIGDLIPLHDGERFLFVFTNVGGNRLGITRLGKSGKEAYLTRSEWSLLRFVYRHFTGRL